MEWNANLYQDKHSFVSEYGKALLEYVPKNNLQVILDLGCGTGDLTYELSKKSEQVIGVDSSEEMIKKAKRLHPELNFKVMQACNLEWKNHFDIVFSNAVFHWIPDQKTLLSGVYQALKEDGKLICEFGAKGNVSAIENSFASVLSNLGFTFSSKFYLPSVETYKALLEQVGFRVDSVIAYDRPTPLKDGKAGLRNWVKQFFASDLHLFSPSEQEQILTEMEDDLQPHLWDGKQWIADYKRIRVIASK